MVGQFPLDSWRFRLRPRYPAPYLLGSVEGPRTRRRCRLREEWLPPAELAVPLARPPVLVLVLGWHQHTLIDHFFPT